MFGIEILATLKYWDARGRGTASTCVRALVNSSRGDLVRYALKACWYYCILYGPA